MYVGSGVLAWHTGSSGLNPQCHINWEWKGTPVIPTLERERVRKIRNPTLPQTGKKKSKSVRKINNSGNDSIITLTEKSEQDPYRIIDNLLQISITDLCYKLK